MLSQLVPERQVRRILFQFLHHVFLLIVWLLALFLLFQCLLHFLHHVSLHFAQFVPVDLLPHLLGLACLALFDPAVGHAQPHPGPVLAFPPLVVTEPLLEHLLRLFVLLLAGQIQRIRQQRADHRLVIRKRRHQQGGVHEVLETRWVARHTRKGIYYVTSVDQKHSRNVPDLQPVSYLRECVNVKLDQFELAFVIQSILFQFGTHFLAWSTPFRITFENYRFIRLHNFREPFRVILQFLH